MQNSNNRVGMSQKDEEIMAQAEVIRKKQWLIEHDHNYTRIPFTKRGKVRWKAQITVGKAGRKYIEASTEDALIERLYEHYNREDGRRLTLKQGIDQYLEHKKEIDTVKPQTLERLEYKSRFWSGLFDVEMAKLTVDDLLRYMKQTSPEYTVQYMKEAVQILHNAFALALQRELIDKNVSQAVVSKEWKKICIQPTRTAEKKIFTNEQIHAIVEKARSATQDIRAYMLLLSIVTGMRSGELSALHWDDVDWDRGYIHVHRQILEERYEKRRTGFVEVPYTKDERGVAKGGRKVFFLLYAESLLRELYQLTGNGTYVFGDNDDSSLPAITPDNYEHWLNDMQTEWGYEVTNNHAFRMSLNSNVLIGMMNMPVHERAKFLGHSEEVNLKNYTYVREDQYEASMRQRVESFNNRHLDISA